MFIFFHLYKCGGNSVRKVLPPGTELHGVHVAPAEILHHYKVHSNEEKFNKMFKFTFVRNPFNFLLSTFYYATIFKNHFMNKDIKGMNMDKFVPYYMETGCQDTLHLPRRVERCQGIPGFAAELGTWPFRSVCQENEKRLTSSS